MTIGEQGEPGERGPTGDHGQDGAQGMTGRVGATGRTSLGLWVAIGLLGLAVVAMFFWVLVRTS